MTGVLLLLAVATGWIVAHIYEDEVRKILVKEVEARLDTKVKVESLSLSLIRKFPFASLTFSKVAIMENRLPIAEADTLAYLENIYLQFNIQDVFHGDYRIKKISAENGFLRPVVDADGKDNYHIWKESEADAEDFFLELEDVEFVNLEFTFYNALKDHVMDLHAGNMQFRGAFSRDQYGLEVDADVLVRTFKTEGELYALDNRVQVQTVIDIDQSSDVYAFEQGHLTVDREMKFDLDGTIKPTGTDLHITGHQLKILSVRTLLPSNWKETIDTYKAKGVIDFEAEFFNAFSLTDLPAISATFGIRNGTVWHEETNAELNNLYVNGKYTNGSKKRLSSSMIQIDSLHAEVGDGQVNGRIAIKNFRDPFVDLNLDLNTSLPDLAGFLDNRSLIEPKGKLQGNIVFAGNWKSPRTLNEEHIAGFKTRGSLSFQDVAFGVVDYPLRFTALEGNVSLHNRDLKVKHFSGSWGPEFLEGDAKIHNFLFWVLLPDQDLVIAANIKGKDLDLDEMIAIHSSDGPERAFSLPDRLVVDAKVELEGLHYKRFTATNLSGEVYLDESVVRADKVKLLALDGSAAGTASLHEGIDGSLGFKADLSVADLDLSALFDQFDNFGQQVIQSGNLAGKATADITFETALDSILQVRSDAIRADVSLEVIDGELIELESLQEVAQNIRDNKVLALLLKVKDLEEDLHHIRFSTLSNEFKIRNKNLFIPKMAIRSTAVDINVEGRHTFDNEIDYKMNFRLAEVLSTKTRRSKSEHDYIELEQDGRTRVYMTMTGTVEDPDVRFERIKIGAIALKREIDKETKTVKRVLNEELGLFKGDTTIKPRDPEPITEARMTIEWEEAEPTAKPQEEEAKEAAPAEKSGWRGLLKKSNKSNKKKSRQINWEEEDDDY